MFGSAQVFGYLHTAWTEIGFTHGDLNCANVMEHRGDADLYLPKGFADKNDQNDKNQLFKLPGMLACQTADCWQVLLSQAGSSISCKFRAVQGRYVTTQLITMHPCSVLHQSCLAS